MQIRNKKRPAHQLATLFAFWLFIVATSAHADRDLVYSARYFYPPGDRRISHYHIYRINPDGTGRIVLTQGNRDDYSPVWSPDGKQVMFLRVYGYVEGHDWIRSLCVVGANGGKVKMLLKPAYGEISQFGWSPDGRWLAYALARQQSGEGYYLPSSQVVVINVKTGRKLKLPAAASFDWSPNSHRLLVWLLFSEGDLHTRIIEPASDKITRIGTQWYNPFWLDNRTVIGVDVKAPTPTLKVFGTDGREQRTVQPRLPAANNTYEFQTASLLEPIPDDPHHVALGFKYGRTAYEWFIIDLQTQSATRLPISDNLTWSPDKKWFCGAPERDLAPLGSGREFVAPLYLYTSSGKRVRNLTPGTVFTERADWRRPQQHQRQESALAL
jgi:hypothetical protein